MSHNQDNRLGARTILWLMLFGAIVGAALYYSAPAKADPVSEYTVNNANRVCVVLAAFPSFNGVAGIAQAIAADGFTYHDAGEIIAGSVIGWCPQYTGLLNSFVAVYAPTHAGAAV